MRTQQQTAMAQPLSFLVIISLSSLTLAMAAYNIVDLGARPDGHTDSSSPLLLAWAMACASHRPATIYVPPGTYFLSQAWLAGPCNNKEIKVLIHGTFVAPNGYSSSTKWVYFNEVEGLSIYGGTLDGRGRALWNCKLAGQSCPDGATTLTIGNAKNILISGLTSINSEMFHVSIQNSNGVTMRGVRIDGPGDSPNTDGINIEASTGVTITGSIIKTGDDCISMKAGTTNVWIERIGCGPGHGISIGSLGEETEPALVQNITVKLVAFTGTQNGLRIKTWGKAGQGLVQDVSFRNAVMNNVKNPIIIDQNYCPTNNCPNYQNSGIQISKVSFRNIRGSSATMVAVKFDCSPSHPCSGLRLKNIKLTYGNQQAQSFCKNVGGSASGFIVPPSCL